MARRIKQRRPSVAGRLIARSAISGRYVETNLAAQIDAIEEQRAAERYWQMVGADLTLEERRERDRKDIPLRQQCAY